MALDRTWYNTLVDDDGSNTVGTLWNKAAVDSLMDAVDAVILPGTSAPTTTGTQTALAIPSGSLDLVLYLNNASLLTVQGIAAGIQGQLLFVFSKGAGQVDFAHLHASGTALGKLKLTATTGLTSLAAGSGAAVFEYDATVTQWRLAAHEQGAWINPAYAGGDYTAATGTWTVDSGDVLQMRYWLKGRTLFVECWLLTTSVSATPTELRRTIPGGCTQGPGNATVTPIQIGNAGGGAAVGMAAANGANLVFTSSIGGAGWATATNNTSVNGRIAFEVT
jgi:hypothetical protein